MSINYFDYICSRMRSHCPVGMPLEWANPDEYDALLLPGGALNPDQLPTNSQAVQFVKSFFAAGKLVATICHGL